MSATAPSSTAGFAPALLERVFPFLLAVDAGGQVLSTGPSLTKLCPAMLAGAPVDRHLGVLSPPGAVLRPGALGDEDTSLFLLATRPGGTVLRGQVVVTGEGDDACALFLGSPWVTSAEQLVELGLTFADFAVHDPAADFLMLLQAQSAALADAEVLAGRLREAMDAQRDLARAEQHLASELEAVPDLLVRLDAACRLVEVRPAPASRRPGTVDAAAAGRLLGQDACDLFPGWAASLPGAVAAALRTGTTQALSFSEETDDAVVHYEARVNASGDAEVLTLVRDVTEHRAMEDRLVHQARTDPLTLLPNRALVLQRMGAACEPASDDQHDQHDGGPVLLLVDLDDFKTVNDTLGHPVGDVLLRAVAGRLLGHVRPEDTVARVGGDEFAVLLRSGGTERGVDVAGRMLRSLRHPFAVRGTTMHVGASIGVARPAPGGDADRWMRDADLAMYDAKGAGKDRCSVFRPEQHRDLVDRMAMESELRSAVAAAMEAPRPVTGEGLHVAYQPVVDLASGAACAVEALARWDHADRGPVPPSTFVVVAEQAGLIGDLGRWVLRTACQQTAAWAGEHAELASLVVSVNLSTLQLEEEGVVDDVRGALAAAGLPAEQLMLEVTETALVDLDEAALARLTALRAMGVKVALDDFGTGYSSLSRLRWLPVDVLKVDRSFVEGAADDAGAAALVRCVVDLAQALDLTVVAEGVETAEQEEALRSMSCDRAQGYLLGRPAGPEELVAALLLRAAPTPPCAGPGR